MITFGTVTQVGRSMFLAVSRVSIKRGLGSSVPQIFWILHMPIRFDLERRFGVITHVGIGLFPGVTHAS